MFLVKTAVIQGWLGVKGDRWPRVTTVVDEAGSCFCIRNSCGEGKVTEGQKTKKGGSRGLELRGIVGNRGKGVVGRELQGGICPELRNFGENQNVELYFWKAR